MLCPMLCPRCRTDNRDGRRFCSKCAAPLAAVCASCGFTNDPGDEFCGGCARSLRAGPPGGYAPKPFAEKILASRSALEGEAYLRGGCLDDAVLDMHFGLAQAEATALGGGRPR